MRRPGQSCAFQDCFECFKVLVPVSQATRQPHTCAYRRPIQDQVERGMKLNGRAVRNHFVAKSQLIFVQPFGSEERYIAVTNGFKRRINSGLPGNRVSEQMIGEIGKILLA